MNNQSSLFIDVNKQKKVFKDSNLEVLYYPNFFNLDLSEKLFSRLFQSIEWVNDSFKFGGKELQVSRRTAFYGDDNKSYTYSGFKRHAIPWTKDLLYIKKKIYENGFQEFNSVLLNDYSSGKVGMGWHSDNEKELGLNPTIASISFGASRDFFLRRKDRNNKDILKIYIENGSLLIMKGKTQHYWSHSIPKRLKIKNRRINLTFRNIIQ